MLSSRYLYLHEALGLGPMWLKRGARIAATPTAEPSATPVAQPNAPTPANTPATPTPNLSEIKSALMQKSATATAFRQPEPQTPSIAPTESIVTQAQSAISADTPALEIAPAILMVVSICPAPEDLIHETLFYGKVGELLDNMLSAIGLNSGSVHKTSWLKTVSFQPTTDELHATLPHLQAERRAAQPKAILFLGKSFQQTDHADIFQQLHDGVPAFTVPHPARLLSEPRLKAEAWTELKKLKALLNH